MLSITRDEFTQRLINYKFAISGRTGEKKRFLENVIVTRDNLHQISSCH